MSDKHRNQIKSLCIVVVQDEVKSSKKGLKSLNNIQMVYAHLLRLSDEPKNMTMGSGLKLLTSEE